MLGFTNDVLDSPCLHILLVFQPYFPFNMTVNQTKLLTLEHLNFQILKIDFIFSKSHLSYCLNAFFIFYVQYNTKMKVLVRGQSSFRTIVCCLLSICPRHLSIVVFLVAEQLNKHLCLNLFIFVQLLAILFKIAQLCTNFVLVMQRTLIWYWFVKSVRYANWGRGICATSLFTNKHKICA